MNKIQLTVILGLLASIAVTSLNGQSSMCGQTLPIENSTLPDENCPVIGVPFSCDYFLKQFGTNPCRMRCFHNDMEKRTDWCERNHHNIECSFDPAKDSHTYTNKLMGRMMGGRCFCCECDAGRNMNGTC